MEVEAEVEAEGTGDEAPVRAVTPLRRGRGARRREASDEDVAETEEPVAEASVRAVTPSRRGRGRAGR